jgi:hypothetical protein
MEPLKRTGRLFEGYGKVMNKMKQELWGSVPNEETEG